MQNREHLLLEVYKTHSTHSQDITKIRDSINAFYIAFHGFFIPYIDAKHSVFILLGIILCILWLCKIEYFTKLNRAKIKCLTDIEQELNFDFYNKEWNVLQQDKGNVIFNKIAMSSGIISRFMPIIVIIVYVLIWIF